MKVLFVCHGNVNRSAAAEIICKQKCPFIEVKSAGLRAKGGTITAKKMRDILNLSGYETTGIRSTEMDKTLLTWADIVFYMDNPNEKKLIAEFGRNKKFQRLGYFAGVDKIPDPGFAKGTDVHKLAFTLIEESITNWIGAEIQLGRIRMQKLYGKI